VESLKTFCLNLRLEVWFEKSLKKKRKKKKTYLLTLSAWRPSSPPTASPQQPTPSSSFSFLFLSPTSRSHRPASPVPFLSSSPPLPRPARRRRKSRCARLPSPSFPPRSSRPIKAVKSPQSNSSRFLPFSPPSRSIAPGCHDHQWQAPAATGFFCLPSPPSLLVTI
jgi:hypothetical protein